MKARAAVLVLGVWGAGCSGGTTLDVTVLFDPTVVGQPNGLDIWVSDEDRVIFGPTRRPDPARPLNSAERVVLALPDGLAGTPLFVHIDGLAGTRVVGSGFAGVTPQLGAATEVEVRLGQIATCGDGILRPGLESCDDGNDDDDDACSNACQFRQPDGGPGVDGGSVDGGGPMDGGGVDGGPEPDGGQRIDGGFRVDGGVLDGGLFDAGDPDAGLPPPVDFVAHWALDGDFLDETGSYAGTGLDDVGFAPGVRGQAAVFDGTDDAVQFAAIDELVGSSELSIALWWRTRSSEADQQLVYWQPTLDGLEIAAENGSMDLEIDNDGRWAVRDSSYLNGEDDGHWHHFVFVFDGDDPTPTRRLRIVVDGEERLGAGAVVDDGVVVPLELANEPFFLSRTTGRAADGWIDDVYVFDRALDTGEMAALRALGDPSLEVPLPPPGQLLRSWSFDTNYDDQVNGVSGIALGDVALGPGVIGQAAWFGGPSDGLDLGGISELGGLGDVSISMWIRDRRSPGFAEIVSIRGAATPVVLGLTTSDDLTFADDTSTHLDPRWAAREPGTWHHVVAVLDEAAPRFYVDGELGPQGAPVFANPLAADFTAARVLVGGADARFQGEIDELSIFGRELTRPDAVALMEAGGGPLGSFAESGLVHHYPLDGDGSEVASGANAFLDGDVSYGWGLEGQGLALLDGEIGHMFSASEISVLSSATAFSISMWLATDGSTSVQTYLRQAVDFRTDVHIASLDGDLFFDVGSGSEDSGVFVPNFDELAPVGQLTHAVFVFDGSLPPEARNRIFVDGVEQATLQSGGAWPPPQSSDLLGSQLTLSWLTEPLRGRLDEVRLYDLALEPDEVTALYERDRPRIPDDWLIWLPFDDTFEDSSGARTGTAAGPPGGAAIHPDAGIISSGLDLVDGWVDYGPIREMGGASAVTMSFWARPRVRPGWSIQCCVYQDESDDLVVSFNGDGRIDFDVGNGSGPYLRLAAGTADVLDGRWHHVAAIYDGQRPEAERARLFIDGVERFGSVLNPPLPTTTSTALSSTPFRAGSQPFPLDGRLDEVLVYTRALTPAEAQALYRVGRESP